MYDLVDKELSLSVAQEVTRFGIKVTLVEPGFFRTDLLAPQSVVFGELAVESYDSPAAVRAQWQAYHGKQSGDPAKLGSALVQLAAMASPPKQFFAGSDAVNGITADLQARLAEVQQHAACPHRRTAPSLLGERAPRVSGDGRDRWRTRARSLLRIRNVGVITRYNEIAPTTDEQCARAHDGAFMRVGARSEAERRC